MIRGLSKQLQAAAAALLIIINVIAPAVPAFAVTAAPIKPVYCNQQGASTKWAAQATAGNSEHENYLYINGQQVLVNNNSEVLKSWDDICTTLYSNAPTITITAPICATYVATVTISGRAGYYSFLVDGTEVKNQTLTSTAMIDISLDLAVNGAGAHTIGVKDYTNTVIATQSVSAGATCPFTTVDEIPASPAQAVVCNRNNDTFTMPTIDTNKITLTDTGWVNGSRTFTYTPATGYTAFSDGTKSKQYVFKDAGDACPVTTPAPTAPVVGPCEFGVAGQTIRKQVSGDVDVRTKVGSGGETNADSWGTTFRLYGATDTAITNMTFTATAMEGMVFVPGTIGAVATGDNNPATDQGALGALDNNGYDATATGIGTPTLSADGKTITLTIANMPAKAPFAFTVNVTPDASGATMVINETMTADQASCPGSISGTTFWDNNLSFSLDSDDTAYGGKTVYLLDADGATIASTVTAADGTYSFSDVPEGTYQVATLTVSGEAITLSHFGTITVGRAQAVTDIDFGFAKTYPVIHNTMPSLAKVDQNTNPLSGAAVTGFNCVRWDGDPNWQCENLSDYGTIDPNLYWDFLIRNMPMSTPNGNTTVDYPSEHRLIMWEASAPAGYTITPKTYAVEYRCGAWRILNVTDRTAEALAAAPATTCDSPSLLNNTFLWVNTIIGGKGGVVEPPVTPAAPTTATELPHTGPATPRDARGILLALIAGVITYGAVYFAQSRRLYE